MVVNFFRCMLATLFPALGMVVLYIVDAIVVKFVLIFFFTAFFTFVLSCFTLAKSIELFIAAATYVNPFPSVVTLC